MHQHASRDTIERRPFEESTSVMTSSMDIEGVRSGPLRARSRPNVTTESSEDGNEVSPSTGYTSSSTVKVVLGGVLLLGLLAVCTVSGIDISNGLYGSQQSAVRQQQGGQSAAGRQLLGEDPPTLVAFTGNQHVETSKWVKNPSGSWSKMRILRRPSWAKSTRCVGDVCEECWESSDCWAPSGPLNYGVSSTGGGTWTHFVSTLHVRCNAPSITVEYKVQNVQRGELRFFLDNVQMSQHVGAQVHGVTSPITDVLGNYQERVGPQSREGSALIELENVGGHTLKIVFVPQSGSGSGPVGAELSKLELLMPESYAQCEDFKACLDPLATNEEARQLRNSNQQQLACLEAPTSDECVMWQYCLVSSNRREPILALLRAAGVGSVTLPSRRLDGSHGDNSTTTLAASSSSTAVLAASSTTVPIESVDSTTIVPSPTTEAGGSNACLNPLLEDAESWACDCFDEMRDRCSQLSGEVFYSEELCLRAMICEHPDVCSAWKDVACSTSDPALSLMRGILQQQRRRLLTARATKASATGKSSKATVDRSLEGKQCV
eukprot:gnl/TRDRNA2_/TRDRNA2_94622_c0_seq1.p1 gnl/TRDRNA2_/TRDRNA2_94622_c0~~gnl/TRDRNA2_/TRDRNA2_94622_c0_seq1.p1  ORF type:complete len:549 (+),score=68.58 gnl/TRDRNA2_/TRDRNA2_94622_c0_seq1:44-1690(+)